MRVCKLQKVLISTKKRGKIITKYSASIKNYNFYCKTCQRVYIYVPCQNWRERQTERYAIWFCYIHSYIPMYTKLDVYNIYIYNIYNIYIQIHRYIIYIYIIYIYTYIYILYIYIYIHIYIYIYKIHRMKIKDRVLRLTHKRFLYRFHFVLLIWQCLGIKYEVDVILRTHYFRRFCDVSFFLSIRLNLSMK